MWLQSSAPLPAPTLLSDHGQKVTDCLTLPRLRLLHHGGADLPPELRAKVHSSSCQALVWNLITTTSQVANAEGTAAAMRADLEKSPRPQIHATCEARAWPPQHRRAARRESWAQASKEPASFPAGRRASRRAAHASGCPPTV